MFKRNQIVRRKAGDFVGPKPEILAPAGEKASFLAALAAGADAVYCGLKSYSARMAARNFTIGEMADMTALARDRGVKVYLTLNTLLKPDDLLPVGRQLDLVQRHVKPDALIIQDLSLAMLARQAGYEGELHLSTLANVSMAGILARLPKTLGVQRVVLPRELNIEEIRMMADACPPDLGLEIFVHGALCYAVSGRCYWSSYLGGKSGLRGRCVQPCRRRYTQGKNNRRFFACQDLSLDVLVKVLASVAQVRAWKIEGRKKGPHYVYYTVSAYQMLRDQGQDPQAKKNALGLLEQALGRPRTHYNFLPQRPQNPVDTQKDSGSGLLIGKIRGAKDKPYFEPRVDLLPRDKLRLGYEDDPWHLTLDLPKSVPRGGKFFPKMPKGRQPANNTAVFLIDRREPALHDRIRELSALLPEQVSHIPDDATFKLRLPPASPISAQSRRMHLRRRPGHRMRRSSLAIWMALDSLTVTDPDQLPHVWWWLPPVIWPEEEGHWQQATQNLLRAGARRFVLNAPWQTALFKHPEQLNIWAGPFCNIANPVSVRAFKLLGGQGVIVGPELGRSDLSALAAKSVLPLGIVISGFWPYCVARILSEEVKPNQTFVSPRAEEGWARRNGNLYWIYPNWPIDLQSETQTLIDAGYRLFVHIDEPVPRAVRIKKRPGKWNWNMGLK
jgi:putative protease